MKSKAEGLKPRQLKRHNKVEDVALGKMEVSDVAQRDLREYRVDELVAEFDIDRLGMPTLNYRDGKFYIVDGQHRVNALRKALGEGWEPFTIPCVVYRGLDVQEEAEMFLRLNNVLNVKFNDRYKVAIVAGRPDELGVKKAVEAQGLHVGSHGAQTPGSVRCIGTLMRVYKRAGPEVLGRSLRIIRDAFGDIGFDAVVVDGMGHFCQRYAGKLDEQHTKARLSALRGGSRALMQRGAALQLRNGSSKALCVGAAIADVVNSGAGGRKLPSWWKMQEAA